MRNKRIAETGRMKRMTRLYPLFSGSSGNAYYLGTKESGILIDIGRSAKQIENALRENELDPKNIRTIFITHEHIDHVRGLRVFASRYGMKVYSSAGTINALEEKNYINDKVNINPISIQGIETDDMKITPFRISHDCAEGYGYVAETSDGRKTAFATDTGYITDDMANALNGCDTVVIESNHDIRMLETGEYPYLLKKRILSDVGHLSNDTCAGKLAELVKSGTTRFLLAHLSRENNMPALAEQTALCELTMQGMKRNQDFILKVAPEQGGTVLLY